MMGLEIWGVVMMGSEGDDDEKAERYYSPGHEGEDVAESISKS